jgi:hypothetical protein
VAGHPLEPATDRRLGSPLHYQQANQTQAPPLAPEGFDPPVGGPHAVLADLSASYSPLEGRYQRVTHPSATNELL